MLVRTDGCVVLAVCVCGLPSPLLFHYHCSDQSRCITADVVLLPPTEHILYEYFTIFFIGAFTRQPKPHVTTTPAAALMLTPCVPTPPGPAPTKLTATVAIVYGVDFALTVCLADRTIVGTLIPYIALEGEVRGEVIVPYIATAAMTLKVTLMEIRLLPQASLSFKSGTSVCVALDLTLRPIKLEVFGEVGFYVCIKLCEVCVSVFGAEICASLPCGLKFCDPEYFPIWEWGMEEIKMNIFVECNTPPDSTPPIATDAFVQAVQIDSETVMASWGGFLDEESNIKGYTACIGTTPGGQDVAECQDMELDQSFKFTMLPLDGMDDESLFVSVLVRNGETLETLLSDRLVVDDSGPEVAFAMLHRQHDDTFVDVPLMKHGVPHEIRLLLRVKEPNPEKNIVVKVVEVAVGLGPASYQDAAEWAEVLQVMRTTASKHAGAGDGQLTTHPPAPTRAGLQHAHWDGGLRDVWPQAAARRTVLRACPHQQLPWPADHRYGAHGSVCRPHASRAQQRACAQRREHHAGVPAGVAALVGATPRVLRHQLDGESPVGLCRP